MCVGIAPSKTLAKLANHLAKQRPEYQGVCDLSTMPPGDVSRLLGRIDVGEVWGVGRHIGARLRERGIATAEALRQTPPKWLRAQFGVVMERTGNELRGLSCQASSAARIHTIMIPE